MSEDTTSLYNHFLEWLSAAQGLGLAHLIQDSRVFIDEIVSIVSSWQPNDPPLPTLFVVLANIFKQIDVDKQTVIHVRYFREVVDAHEKNLPIPPIPSAYYPDLNTIPPIASAVAVSKRKADDAVSGTAGRTGKRQKTLSVASADSDSEGDDLSDGEDESEEEENVEQSETESGRKGRVDNDDSMAIDTSHGDHRSGRMSSSTKPSQKSPAEQPPTSSRLKRLPRPVVEIIAPKQKGNLASHGLTPAQLEDSWRAQAGPMALKDVPQVSKVSCKECTEDGVICWTVPKMKACVYCRHDKKQKCSNANKTAKAPKPPKDDVQEGNQGKTKKTTKTTIKEGKVNAPKSSAADTTPTAIAPIKLPPITPTIRLSKGKGKAKADITQAPSVVDTIPKPSGSRQVSVKKLDVTLPPDAQGPAATLAEAQVIEPRKQRARSRSQSTLPAAPSGILPPITISTTAGTHDTPTQATATPVPWPNSVNPLICPPASDAEARCEYSPLDRFGNLPDPPTDIPPYAGSSIIPRPPTPTPTSTTAVNVVTGDLYARIGGLEAEVRRMAQENVRLRDELVQGYTQARADLNVVRKEMRNLRKECFGAQEKQLNRTWDLSRDVSSMGKQVGELGVHVRNLQKLSTTIAAQPFPHSSFPSSSGDTPNDSMWAGYTHNTLNLFDPPPQADHKMQTSDCPAALQLASATSEDSTTPTAAVHAADGEEGSCMAVNTEQRTDDTMTYMTVNPQDMQLGQTQQQAIPATYVLGE